ncbi:MAG: DUF362 domain-containing protein [Clostridiales bacterium]|nr:DUF362 domain-containing protein [Clostridiales bacterium]
MKKNDIYMIQGTDYKDMTMELLRECNLAADIGDRGKKIGIKPNLVVAKPASSGATTHPEILDGLLAYLREEGFKNLKVLEGSWVGDSTARAVRTSGLLDICNKYNVPFVDLQKDSSAKVEAHGMKIAVCDEARKIEYMINMPVLKGHCQTIVTCALKNAKGLIPNSEKRRFHSMGLHKPIAHLNTAIWQDFILVDNICGDLDFEEGGNPVTMNRVLAFKDPVLCDSFTAEAMGYHPYDIEYIRRAENLGIGTTDTSSADIHNLRPEGYRAKMPSPRGRVGNLAKYVKAKDACSACYGSLIYALDRLDDEGFLRGKRNESIAIGQGYQGESGKLGIGKCTKCFEKNLMGCSPKAVEIAEFLRNEWDS